MGFWFGFHRVTVQNCVVLRNVGVPVVGLDVTVLYVVVVIIVVVFRFSAIAVAAVPAQALPPNLRVLPLGLVVIFIPAQALPHVPRVLPLGLVVIVVPAQALPHIPRVLPLGLISGLERVPLVLPGSSLGVLGESLWFVQAVLRISSLMRITFPFPQGS